MAETIDARINPDQEESRSLFQRQSPGCQGMTMGELLLHLLLYRADNATTLARCRVPRGISKRPGGLIFRFTHLRTVWMVSMEIWFKVGVAWSC